MDPVRAEVDGRRRWRSGLRSYSLVATFAAVIALDAPARAAGEGPPPPTLAELVQVTDLSGLAPSPDGRLVAFRSERPSIGANSYELTWHIFDVASGHVVEVAPGGEPIIEDPGRLAAETPVWSSDARWIHYRALNRGEVQIWRAAADGSATQMLTAERGDVLAIEPTAAGTGLIYRVGPAREAIVRAELDEYAAGILVDQHVELGQNVFRAVPINGRPASQRLTGRWFDRGGVLWNHPPVRRRLDLSSLVASDTEEDPAAAAGAARGAGTPAAEVRSQAGDLASATRSQQESTLTVRRREGVGDTIICAADACRRDPISWLAWRPGADQLVFASTDRARVQTLHVWDIASNQVRLLTKGAGLLSGGRDPAAPCAVGAAFVACVDAGPASPPRLLLVDLMTGEARPAYDPNAGLRARAWPRHERLSWEGAGGQVYTGIMFLPAQGAPRPAPLFVNYYQCDGFLRGGVGDEWPFAALASAGIVSVCVNMTRSGASEDGVGRYRAAQEGVRSLIDLLGSRGLIDRRRVGMGGLSFGSEVTMWTVMHSDLIAAASVASPQFEPANYWFNNVRGRDHRDMLRRFWGLASPDETPEQWRLLSPALNVQRITAPLLLQLPEQEARYAIELYARLSNSPTPTEMYVFPDERHIKTQPVHRLATYGRNLDWFRFWLQDHVDPDPEKADQYRRWRMLQDRARSASQRARGRSQSSSEARSNRRK